MRKIIKLLVLLFLNLAAVSQDSAWYGAFSGRIGQHPVVLQLHQTAGQYTGFYYYQRSQLPIEFTGMADNGNLRLRAFSQWDRSRDAVDEVFVLNLHGDSLTGTWQLTDTSRRLDVALARESKPPFSLRNFHVTGNTRLRPGRDDSPAASFDASLLWPAGKQTAAVALQKAISKFAGAKETIINPQQYLDNRKKTFLNDYQAGFRDVADSDWVEFPAGYAHDQLENMRVVYFSDKWISLSRFFYSFTGGAHGNYASQYLCFDIRQEKALRLGDVLMPSGIVVAPEFLAENLRRQLGLMNNEPLSNGGLFENEVPVTENFYLTGTGIVFSYPPYEIAPYALGEIQVFLTFQQMKAYLQPAFAEIIR